MWKDWLSPAAMIAYWLGFLVVIWIMLLAGVHFSPSFMPVCVVIWSVLYCIADFVRKQAAKKLPPREERSD